MPPPSLHPTSPRSPASQLLRTATLSLVFTSFACSSAGGGCGSGYVYPRDEPGAAATPQVMRARLTPAGFDQTARGLAGVLAASCSTEFPTHGALCAVDDVDAPRWLHVYLGSPDEELSFSMSGAEAIVRTGAPAGMDSEREGGDWNWYSTSPIEARSYCDDTGGMACSEMLRRGLGTTGQGFCRPGNAPGCDDPATDYCCGDAAPGMCSGALALSSCKTERSSMAIDLDSLRGNIHFQLIEDANGPGIEVILGCTAADPDDCTDPSEYVRVSTDLAVYFEVSSIGDAACYVRDDPSKDAALAIRTMRFIVRPRVAQGLDGRPQLVVDDSAVEVKAVEFDIFDVAVDPIYDDPGCYDESWSYFTSSEPDPQFEDCEDWCLGGIWPFVGDMLSGSIAESFARSLARTAMQQLAGKGVEAAGLLDIGGFVPFVNRHAAPVDYLVAANPEGTWVSARSGRAGMNIDLDVGFLAQPGPGVRQAPLPELPVVEPPVLGETVRAADPVTGVLRDEPYDLALLIGEAVVRRAAVGLFNSGNLRLDVPADEVGELTGGAFVPTVGALSLLAPDLAMLAPLDAPVDMGIVPHLPPVLALGSGVAVEGVPESHFKLHWPDVEVAFYPLVDNVPLRALAFAADLTLGISLAPGPDGDLLLLIDRLEVSRVAEMYNEIGGAFDPGSVEELIAAFIPALLSGEPINLDLTAAALGIPFVPKVRAVKRFGAAGGHLGVFLRFCTDEDLADAANPLCFEEPEALSRDLGAMAAFAVAPVAPGEPIHDGRLVVQTMSQAPRLELAYRVDDLGPYFGFVPVQGDAATIEHPLLRVAGEHTITVVARDPERPGTWSAPQRFEVVVVPTPRAMSAPPAPEPAATEVARAPESYEGCAAAGAQSGTLLAVLLVLARARRRAGRDGMRR